jgi:hypothetical protein
MMPPVLTEEEETVINSTSLDWCYLAAPVSSSVKTTTSYSKDGELHNGCTAMAIFLAGEQTVSSHHDVVENSGAHNFFQWCHRFLCQVYSSQSKMMIRNILVVLRSRIL